MKLPVLFISHGGGPWPWIDGMRESYAVTMKALETLGQTIKPKAVLSVSGHWEADAFTVATHPRPPMEYDYGGFPAHTYKIQYPAAGGVDVAARIKELLKGSELELKENSSKGLDHGTFVPLSLIYPQADVPIGQVSIKRGYSPAEHFKLGQLLAPLRDEGVLIIASGLSYHNMRGFFSPAGQPVSKTFGKWLTETVESSPSEREARLMNWAKAPMAREAHPYEDHLIPLMVAAGAAGNDKGKLFFIDTVGGIDMISYEFGNIV